VLSFVLPNERVLAELIFMNERLNEAPLRTSTRLGFRLRSGVKSSGDLLLEETKKPARCQSQRSIVSAVYGLGAGL
jgi:hypothetical protein